ncbi:sodium:proton antiporter NhaD [Salinisphaera sp.]|uniref:sodium:proton antiporter NhaD n=1 Tax=Salinisphaera sp. TaxID=1914330 RepID=UPI002D77326D|nr:sodium:proton antiporter NhaD [Salinisphaera sp.]HET7313919.1 sodium:proton antiporter NhaD [Salinisphaera sp.]
MTAKRMFLAWAPVVGGWLLPITAWAAESGSGAAGRGLDLTTAWPGLLALALFVVAYVLVALEEYTDLRKSKPVILAAGLIWMLIAAYVHFTGVPAAVEDALTETLVEFAGLFLFLLVAMTYVNAMTDRHIFEALRTWLAARGYSYRKLFWIVGFLAFIISPAIDNLTTALVLSAVALAVGGGNKRFISLACINIVVGANAGGAFSPFGDITTLMVWQTGVLNFFEFFRLFVPALVNFVVPAAIMQFAVPSGAPEASEDTSYVRRGGYGVLIAFAATIATAVIGHSLFDLPPYLGMMLGLAYLQLLMYFLMKTALRKDQALAAYREADEMTPPELIRHEERGDSAERFNVFGHVAEAEWDTLLFFYGVLLCVGGLAFLGYLSVLANALYGQIGATWANTAIGVMSAIVDNIPIMAAVIQMHPSMPDGQWLLVTLTAGVGGSLLSIGSAAGVALMGQARGYYTFVSHLKWSWAVALGYAASIWVHMLVNAGMF